MFFFSFILCSIARAVGVTPRIFPTFNITNTKTGGGGIVSSSVSVGSVPYDLHAQQQHRLHSKYLATLSWIMDYVSNGVILKKLVRRHPSTYGVTPRSGWGDSS